MKVNVVQMPHAVGLPAYATDGAAGMDLVSAEDATIFPGGRLLIATGIKVAVPPGYEMQIRPRSGLAIKSGISVLNTPGTVDSDYRGEVKVILVNHGADAFPVKRGDRIAQAVFAPVMRAVLNLVADLDTTERGGNGFGSSGVR